MAAVDSKAPCAVQVKVVKDVVVWLRNFAVYLGLALLSVAGSACAQDAIQSLKPDGATVAAMRSAIAAYRAGDLATGDAAAQTVKDPLMRTTLEWVALRAASDQAGFDRISAFLDDHPDWPAVTPIRRKGEEALYNEKRDDRTILAYFAAHPPLTSIGRGLDALSLEASGRVKEASDIIRKSWHDDAYPLDLETDINARFQSVLTSADHRERMDSLLLAENWAPALRAADLAGGDMPVLAKISVAVGKRAPEAEKLLQSAPSSVKDSETYILALAQFLRRNDRLTDAAAALSRIKPTVTPTHPDAWWTERRVLIRRLLEDGKAPLAMEIAAHHPGIGASNLYEAAFLQGWIALDFLKDSAKAEPFFAEAETRAASDTLKSRAAYWHGLALEAQGKSAVAAFARAAQYQLVYYGQLGAFKSGGAVLGFRAAPPPDASRLTALPAFRAMIALLESGGDDYASIIASDIAPRVPDATSLSAIAALGHAYNDIRLITLTGKTSLQRGYGFDLEAWPVEGFPLPPDPAVEPAFAYAIARQESSFDPHAVSGAGARGMMQLMVATAQETAKKAKLDFNADRLTADASYNVLVGTTHLGELVDYWGGSYILATAAYNAGSANVKKWIAAYGDPRDPSIDPVRWIEKIPVTETRFYVQRVMENLAIYRARLEGRMDSSLLDDLKRGVPH